MAKSNVANKTEGLVSFIMGVVSIFYMAPVFVPLAIITGIVALFKKQFLWGMLGLICAFIGFITSLILLAALGLTAIAIHAESLPKYHPPPNYQIEQPDQLNKPRVIGI